MSKQNVLLLAAIAVAAILLAVHSYDDQFAELPPTARWIRTVGYAFGPWLCAFAFAGTKMAIEKLLSKETEFQKTFVWVAGAVLVLMVLAKIVPS